MTIEQVAEKGYAGASLSRIAEAAGITKAAVLYHFTSKEALVDAAYQHVLTTLVDAVGTAIEAASDPEGPATYVRSMIGHFAEHPRHTRVIIEAMSNRGRSHSPQERWGPLAQLIDTAAMARASRGVDSRTLAIIVGGAVDAIVSERLSDPDYDTTHAADRLADLIDVALSR